MNEQMYTEMSRPEMALLQGFIGALAVDLGTFRGGSAYLLSQSHVKVITIDVFENIDFIEDPVNKEHYKSHFASMPHTFEDIKFNLSRICKNVEVRCGLTYKGHDDVNFVDTLFVDADHSYNGAKKDFEYWFPRVKDNGIIMFHDSIKRDYHEVYLLVDELLERKDIVIIGYINSLTVWQKTKKE